MIGKKKGGRGGRSTPLASWRLGTGGSLNLATKRGGIALLRPNAGARYPDQNAQVLFVTDGRDATVPPKIPLVPSLQRNVCTVMILPQVHLRKPCYDFYFL